jgi:hypothetical protein
MNEIVLTDEYLENLTRNSALVRDYGFIRDASDSLRGINRKGCSCNWSKRVRAVLEQMRSSFTALIPEEITKIKKTLGVEDRQFLCYRQSGRGVERKVL